MERRLLQRARPAKHFPIEKVDERNLQDIQPHCSGLGSGDDGQELQADAALTHARSESVSARFVRWAAPCPWNFA